MDVNILHSAGYLFYVLALFVGAGVLAWLVTRILKSKHKQYSLLLILLILFPPSIPYLMWDTWQIHLLFPLVYLFLVCAFQQERASNFYLPVKLRYDNPALALGVFFIYAFASTVWAYFPMQNFMMTLFQFISVSFAYLIFKRIRHIHSEVFVNNKEIVWLFLVIGIGIFGLFLFVSRIVPEIYSMIMSILKGNVEFLSTDPIIAKYLEVLTRLFQYRIFFDSGFTFFAVLAFPLAMLLPNRKASLFLLGGIFLVILVVSNSQASMLGLLCGIFVVLLLPKLPGWARQTMPWVMLGGVTLFPFITTLLLPTTLEFFSLAFIKESFFFINTLEPRLWIYENTIFLDVWMCLWFGCGIGSTILDAYNNVSIFNTFFAASAYHHTHNHTLILLVELGIIGLLLFLWVCACILRTIETLNEQCQPYALGAFFSALCSTAFTQPLWGTGIIICCSAFLIFSLFARFCPVSSRQTDPAT